MAIDIKEKRVNRYQFEILAYIEKNDEKIYSTKTFADDLKISGTMISKCVEELVEKKLIIQENEKVRVTDLGLEALEPYRVKKAVILAAGFGSRMMPATAERPKPMVKVNGVRIIDTLLDALVAVGIKDITIVRGYKKECFNEILDKSPFLKLIDYDI